jgi:NADPH-dependent F420 reductase
VFGENIMHMAILGTGQVGGTLGIRWASKGHRITYGVRDPQAAEVRQVLEKSGARASAASLREAAVANDLIVIAVPWNVTQPVLQSLGDLAGKILVDCTNPVGSDLSRMELGFTTSAAEQIAGWAPGTKVVKAFNTVSAATLADPWYDGKKAAMFYCGDDEGAKAVIKALTADLELEPVDAGPLKNARYLEPLALLYIHLAVFGGWGANCAFRMVKR